MAGYKGDCGGEPRVGQPGDVKPRPTKTNRGVPLNRPMRGPGRGLGRGLGRPGMPRFNRDR